MHNHTNFLIGNKTEQILKYGRYRGGVDSARYVDYLLNGAEYKPRIEMEEYYKLAGYSSISNIPTSTIEIRMSLLDWGNLGIVGFKPYDCTLFFKDEESKESFINQAILLL